MDDVTLYTGDCAQVMRERIADGSIDLTVTSPPYDNLRAYKGYTFDFEAIAAQLWRVTKPGGMVVWVVADATINGSETGTSFRQALYFMSLGFNLHDTMIYAANKPPVTANRYEPEFEFMFVLSKGNLKTWNPLMEATSRPGHFIGSGLRYPNGEFNGRAGKLRTGLQKVRGNIWTYYVGRDANDGMGDHPAVFPEALARDHIASWSNPGDLVLDPMCGSGTTIKMAVLAQRRAIGIDIAQEYIELTQQRVDDARAQLHLFPLASNNEIKLTRTAGSRTGESSSDEAQPVLLGM